MKKICFVISFFLFATLLYMIVGTYGLFETKNNRVVETGLGKWTVLINDVDVTKELEFDINTINWNENENVKSNKIAPGVSGYFDITIDPTDTDVSVRYDAIFDFSVFENTNIVVNSISEIDGKNVVKTAENTYTGVIELDEIKNNVTHTIRVNVAWENDDNDNVYDTEIGVIPDNTIEIPIMFKVLQYTGETIVEYEE